MAIDWNAYVGIPFESRGRGLEGADCYGLGWLIYRDIGIDLPLCNDLYADANDPAVSRIVEDQSVRFWQRVDPPQPLDFITLRVAGLPWHVGIYMGVFEHRPLMIHVQTGRSSRIERLDTEEWKPRILGYWRYGKTFPPPCP